MEYEAWFGSSQDYTDQKDRNLVQCPGCDSLNVTKTIMAPSVTKKSNQRNYRQLAKGAHRYLEQNYENVGERFADEALAMSTGQKDQRRIYGALDDQGAEKLDEAGIEYGWIPPKPRDDA
jgi:hypothetical protein